MSAEYAAFLERKAQLDSATGAEPVWLPDWLFPFQRFMVEWGIRQGRAALLEDCGMGKGPQELVWAENVRRITGKPALIVCPLAVSFQMIGEAHKFGIEAAISRDGAATGGITVTNYDRLGRFASDDFGGVVCDESSCIKAYDSGRRAAIAEFLRRHRWRLLCTATAAPNDFTELGTSSEALGYLGYQDMLTRFFTNDRKTGCQRGRFFGQAGEWRFKGHAEAPFWRWVASWARALRKPSDLGFADDRFVLPPLAYRRHIVTPATVQQGRLFDLPAIGLRETREESRRTLVERCERVADLLGGSDYAVAWGQLNAETDLLERLIPGAVQVSGHEPMEAKEEKLTAFSRGEVRALVTKPLVAGWGLNWQHCAHVAYLPDYSYERFYQAVRRVYRFGQRRPVTVDLVTTPGGEAVLETLERKAEQAGRMFDALIGAMRHALHVDRQGAYPEPVRLPGWLTEERELSHVGG